MKIKMLTLAAGPEGITRPGSVIDVDETTARQLIKGCYAIMEADDGNNKTTASSGTTKPRRGKTASAE